METPQTFRLQAELCARQAEHAKTPQQRASLMEMTKTWLRLADWATAERQRTKIAELVIPIRAPAANSARPIVELRQYQH